MYKLSDTAKEELIKNFKELLCSKIFNNDFENKILYFYKIIENDIKRNLTDEEKNWLNQWFVFAGNIFLNFNDKETHGTELLTTDVQTIYGGDVWTYSGDTAGASGGGLISCIGGNIL